MHKRDSKTNIPSELGYRMPAEWHPHSATQLHWPSNRDTWPGERLERVEKVYLDIIQVLHKYEPIVLLAESSAMYRAEQKLKDIEVDRSNVHLFDQQVNDVWARDCGPVFVHRVMNGNHEYAITDWEYNAWGEKYPPFDDDNKLPGFFSEMFGITRYETDLVLEGGSVETNGEGIIITTESVILNKNRNPGLDKSDVEKALQNYLGIEKIIWLKRGLAGDDTDGHVDDLSRFLNKGTILTVVVEDPDDINYEALNENYQILQKSTDLEGNPFNIEVLPLPETKIEGTTVDGSEYVPASYANFYIANGVVLVPMYNSAYDQQAIELLIKYFPDRDVTGIPCADLVWGQGSIHCITQQLYGINQFPVR